MTEESIQPLLTWINAHPHWSGLVVFIISLSESLAVVGLIVPGWVIMTAIGTLVGKGILPAWSTLSWAAFGAVIGDGISYWLGYYYKELLHDIWPFSRFPKWLERGQAFFHHFGSKSIIFGRFVGPVRPMIPVIAGMMNMPPRSFFVANVISALLWAPIYCFPGIVIGASLESLSPEIASRLGFFILISLFALWLIYSVIHQLSTWLHKIGHRYLQHFWAYCQKHPGSFLYRALRLPHTPQQHQILPMTIMLIAALGFIIVVCQMKQPESLMSAWDQTTYYLFRILHRDTALRFWSLWTGLATPFGILSSAAFTGGYLLWQRRLKAPAIWLGIIGFGVGFGYLLKPLLGKMRPEGLVQNNSHLAFPSGHTLTTTLIFFLTLGLLHRSLKPVFRILLWSTACLLILLTGLSRLYLGQHWLSDVLGSFCYGVFFAALGVYGYRRLSNKPLRPQVFLWPLLIALIVNSIFFQWHTYPTSKDGWALTWSSHRLETEKWWLGDSPREILQRQPMVPCRHCYFNLQWLGPLTHIQSILKQEGFEILAQPSRATALNWFTTEPLAHEIPAIPAFHQGRLPSLTAIKHLGSGPEKRLLIHLWPSNYSSAQDQTLWVGVIQEENLHHPIPKPLSFISFYKRYQKADENAVALFLNSITKSHNHFQRIDHPLDKNLSLILIQTP